MSKTTFASSVQSACPPKYCLELWEAGFRRLRSHWPWRNHYEHSLQSPSPRTIPGSLGSFFPKLIMMELIGQTKWSPSTNVALSKSLANTKTPNCSRILYMAATSTLVDKTQVLNKKLTKYSPIDPLCSSGFGEEQITVGKLLKSFSPYCDVELAALQPTAISHWGAIVGVEARQHTGNKSVTTLERQIK